MRTTLLLLALAAVLAVVLAYNHLVRARVRVRHAWAQVAVQLQRRADLVPELVRVVEGYAAHERGVFEDVARARSAALAGVRAGGEEPDALSVAMTRLLALGEGYPELRADGRFAHLASELRDTEDRIAFARDFANHRVARYQSLIETFPLNLLARPFRFLREGYFAIEDPAARRAPSVGDALGTG